MSRGSRYKPETPRKGTEQTTNDRNIQNIFAILNRIQDQLNNLEESYNTFVNVTFPSAIAEAKAHSIMMMDDD